ncbi:MAG: RnfABCDGE type electron transport complex subunit D [Pseudomonadota bacterium]
MRYEPWPLLRDYFLRAAPTGARAAPFIRDSASVRGLSIKLVIATLPCWLIGLWSVGYQSNQALGELGMTTLPGWRGSLIDTLGVGYAFTDPWACFFLGLLYFLPVFLVALLTSVSWELVFASVRRRHMSEGILAFAWLFALVLPAGVPLYQVAVGVSFGFIVGSAIYGGYGYYLVNPVLLGLAFLLFAYPDLVFGPNTWVPVPGFETSPPLRLAAAGGIEAVHAAGMSTWDLFLGLRPGPLGATSVLGCLLGALYLVVTATVSWRIMLGAALGMTVTALLFDGFAADTNQLATMSGHWHLLLSGFVFGVVFFATDPVAAANTRAGRWMFGALVGVLTIVISASNPSYNEGVLFAVLLASLFSPVLDFLVVERNVRRRRRRLEEGAA